MITDYSLQFRLIQQHEREDKKYLNTSISSTYGSALVLTNSEETWRGEGQYYTYIRDVWTDFLERHEYVDFENFNYRSKNFIYNERDDKGKSFIIKHNCDGRVVAVANSASKILFYGANLVAPYEECHHSVRPIHATKLSNSSAKIKMLEWNPMNPEMFVGALAKTLYTMLFNFKEQASLILAKRDMYAPMTAVSWNPKGTQLIVGDAEGRIFQFNPQLKLIRIVNPPDLTTSLFPDKFGCSGICWVSKTERIVVFTNETSDKLHLTKLTVKPNKPPKWTAWDVLPAAESTENSKTFNFLPIFKWNTVLMSSPCLSEVYTFGIVNNVWQPLKLDERFNIKAPIDQIIKPVEHKTKLRYDLFRNKGKPKNFESILPTSTDVHKFKKTFITSMSINYSSQQNVITSQCSATPPQPVIYITTSTGVLLVYQMVSLYSDRPSLAKPAEIVDKSSVKNGPHKHGYNLDSASSTDSDASSHYSSHDWPEKRVSRRQKKGTRTVDYEKTAEAQANMNDENSVIMELRKEIMRLRENDINEKQDLANYTCLRLIEAGELSAYGVLEVYAAENETFNDIRDIKERWLAMYHGDAKLIAEMKRLHCKLSADEFVAAVLSILSKPAARIMNLDADGLTVKGSDFFRVENTVLEVVCGVMLVKFTIV